MDAKRLWLTMLGAELLYVSSLLLILAGLWMVFPLALGLPLAIATLYVISRFSGSSHPLGRALAALAAGIVVGGVAGLFPESLDPHRAGAVAFGCAAPLVVALLPTTRIDALLRPAFVILLGAFSMIPPSPVTSAPEHAYVITLSLPILLALWVQGILVVTRDRLQTAES